MAVASHRERTRRHFEKRTRPVTDIRVDDSRATPVTWWSRADRFWAGELGVDAALLRSGDVHLHERVDPRSRPPVIVVSTSCATVLSVARAHLAAFTAAGLDIDAMKRDPRGYLGSVCADSLEVRGPAYLGYWPTSASASASRGRIRELGPADQTALAALRDVAPDEWNEAGFGAGSRLFGQAADGVILAVAGYETWLPDLAQLQVLCHPDHRRRGMATGVLNAVIEHALGARLLPQYRARDGNVASRGLAARLGFVEYGWMATIYLHEA